MLVVDLGKWMNKTLINWGIDPAVADRFDETIMALLMIVVAIVLNYLCQAILIGGMKQYTRRKPHQWNTLLMKRKVSTYKEKKHLQDLNKPFHRAILHRFFSIIDIHYHQQNPIDSQ